MSCAIIPKVLNNRGEKVDSKLFKDLLSFSPNRATAVDLYKRIKTQKFNQLYGSKIDLDINGEPTFASLLRETDLNTFIPENEVLETLNRKIGYYKKGMDRPALWINNAENYSKLAAKARKFNLESEYRDKYVATVIDISDTESFRIFKGIKIVPRDQRYSIEAERLEYSESLNEKLRDILTSKGIKVGSLTELERRLGINGVTDFDQAQKSAEGMIELIRIAEGERGETALPEEFAHFALEAMGDDNPLVNRLVNLIVSENLASEIIGDTYEAYEAEYSKDRVKLAKEAAGKLVARHLLNQEAIPNKPYKNLLQRVISSIKNFFRGLSADSIHSAMDQANKTASSLASGILDGTLTDSIDVKNISKGSKFFNLAQRNERTRTVLKRILDNELKRLKVYESRNPNSSFSSNQKMLIETLENKYNTHAGIDGVFHFIEHTLGTLKALSTRLEEVNKSNTSLNEKCKVLRDIRNYYFSFKSIVSYIKEDMLEEKKEADDRYNDIAKAYMRDINELLDDLYIEYSKSAMPHYVSFLKSIIGDGIEIPFGKWKGKVITAEDLSMVAEDISFFDRWLDSMADSSSYVLKIFDQAVKKAKGNARLTTIDDKKEIEAAAIRLEQAGIKDTAWMFERDSDGNLTGEYISEIDYNLFREDVKRLYRDLRDKYGDNPVGANLAAYNRERTEWFNAHMEVVNGSKQPRRAIYETSEYSSLSAAQKKYYHTMMEIKDRLDSYLPAGYTHLTNAIKIRKDLLERIKSSKDVKSGALAFWESLKDHFIRRSDDTGFGTKATIIDFEGHEVQTLPIYYTKLKEGESANDLSTDVSSTMIAYAAMANDFNEMNKIINVLELSRDMIRDNLEVDKTRGNKKLVEKFKVMGRTIENKVIKSKGKSRIHERLDDYFEMQVYGRYIADEGTFGKTKIDKAKVADALNTVTSLNTLAFNVLSSISNVATGKVMMRIESLSGQFFSEKDTIWADKMYAAEMPYFLAEIGKRVKTSKIALFSELFNVMQDYESEIKDTNFDRKTRVTQIGIDDVGYFTTHAGEHWMQHRTALALAHKYKMIDPNGNEVNLWDALEVVYMDPNNKALGAKLKVKRGYTNRNGEEFSIEDIIKFSRKSAAINQRMHGIYNQIDKNALQRLALGRMGMIFRKWIKPSLNRRFKSATKNLDLDDWTEGYYRTLGDFMLQTAKELRHGQFNLIANWDNLEDFQKANIIRATTEIGHFLIICAALALISWDDKESVWSKKMLEYQLRRLKSEIGIMIPGKSMIDEGLRIIKSPAAAIQTIQSTLDLINLLNPYNYGEDAILKSGPFKGHTKGYKYFMKSPLSIVRNTISRDLDPGSAISFFTR